MKITSSISTILTHEEETLFEKSQTGRVGYSLPTLPFETNVNLPKEWVRSEVEGFPEISENEIVRHFVRLSQKNYHIDTGFYPLGSCTMKYNPKVNDELALQVEFAELHPFWPESFLQPALAVQFQLENLLSRVSGLSAFTLQPSAGAHGEYAGIKMMQAYHRDKGNQKTKVLVPDSAHGTNPATCSMIGYEIVKIPTGENGIVEIEDVKPLIDDGVAGIMMTNPNTLGLFETHIKEIADLIHEVDGLFYMDGANFNAILGITKPSDLGVDIMHINLHKTFSTPHGGGGPGSGPVGVVEKLKDFLPTPVVVQKKDGKYSLMSDLPKSIGRVGGYYGNFSIHLRALAYMLSIGQTADGKDTYLKKMSTAAVLNANYIRKKLSPYFEIPYPHSCMHEVVLSDAKQVTESQVETKHLAKRLMDYGYHPMTVYFPLVVHGAMMIEPTESETIETLNEFCDAMISIAKEAKETPEIVKNAPNLTYRRQVDELRAQKQPQLRWEP